MKRSAFIAALLGYIGIGKAQQWKQAACFTDERSSPHVRYCFEGHDGKALNNQCPVCGEMAASWKFRPRPKSILGACGPLAAQSDGGTYLTDCEGKHERLIRCKRCNAAFWQDSSAVANERK